MPRRQANASPTSGEPGWERDRASGEVNTEGIEQVIGLLEWPHRGRGVWRESVDHWADFWLAGGGNGLTSRPALARRPSGTRWHRQVLGSGQEQAQTVPGLWRPLQGEPARQAIPVRDAWRGELGLPSRDVLGGFPEVPWNVLTPECAGKTPEARTGLQVHLSGVEALRFQFLTGVPQRRCPIRPRGPLVGGPGKVQGQLLKMIRILNPSGEETSKYLLSADIPSSRPSAGHVPEMQKSL